jgi:hypothetical protein
LSVSQFIFSYFSKNSMFTTYRLAYLMVSFHLRLVSGIQVMKTSIYILIPQKIEGMTFVKEIISFVLHEGVFKSFRTGRLELELQMVQFSSTGCSCIVIL